jgi:hypothetical protein
MKKQKRKNDTSLVPDGPNRLIQLNRSRFSCSRAQDWGWIRPGWTQFVYGLLARAMEAHTSCESPPSV